MKITPDQEARLLELEGKQNLTDPEANELQILLDYYYDQVFEPLSDERVL